jgi:hypothetical protein
LSADKWTVVSQGAMAFAEPFLVLSMGLVSGHPEVMVCPGDVTESCLGKLSSVNCVCVTADQSPAFTFVLSADHDCQEVVLVRAACEKKVLVLSCPCPVC